MGVLIVPPQGWLQSTITLLFELKFNYSFSKYSLSTHGVLDGAGDTAGIETAPSLPFWSSQSSAGDKSVPVSSDLKGRAGEGGLQWRHDLAWGSGRAS